MLSAISVQCFKALLLTTIFCWQSSLVCILVATENFTQFNLYDKLQQRIIDCYVGEGVYNPLVFDPESTTFFDLVKFILVAEGVGPASKDLSPDIGSLLVREKKSCLRNLL